MTEFNFPKELLPFRKARDTDAYVWEEPIERHLPDSRVLSRGRELLMLGGYSYLGIIGHPDIAKAMIDAIHELGSGSLGASAMAGTSKYHKLLERELADFWRRDEAILYPTGFAANLSVVNALMRTGDCVFIDIAAHMSLHDACAQTGAMRVLFRHNSVEDLERKLSKHSEARNKLVIVDGAYSMDGDLCPLPEIAAACKVHGAFLLVDECHSFGMLPPCGGGVEEYFGLPPDTIDFRIGTLSKAIPSHGGFVTLSNRFSDFVRHHGHHNIYSGSVPGPLMAAALEGVRLLRRNPQWPVELAAKSQRMKQALNARGFDTGESVCAIVPLIVDDVDHCMRMAKAAFRHGIYVQPVLFPAVKRSRLRIGVSNALSFEQIEWAAEKLERAYNDSSLPVQPI